MTAFVVAEETPCAWYSTKGRQQLSCRPLVRID